MSPAPSEAPGPAPPQDGRLRDPHVRGVLLEQYREARRRLRDPVLAWADVQGDPARRRRYQRARGTGGLVRVEWDEAVELVAAAYVHTLGAYGPDRIAGLFPADAPGARLHTLIGAPVLVSEAPARGDDWADAAYLLVWGGDLPVTRSGDAWRLARARYRGQKVVAVGPGARAGGTRPADEVLHPHPGTDGALALAMGHVVLKEFFVDRESEFFAEHARRSTDLPFLVRLEERGEGTYAPGTFLRAADLGRRGEHAACRAVVLDEATGRAAVPEPGVTVPVLSLYGREVSAGAEVLLPHFDAAGRAGVVRRGVPVTRLGGASGPLVTTVFDLLLACYGVVRPELPGRWPQSYADADSPGTPAWQETQTSVPAATCARIAREFARTAERSGGRCVILTGDGTRRPFHADTLDRALLALLALTGCPDGSPAPSEGSLPVRRTDPAAYWYLHTGRWRHESSPADVLASPLGRGRLAGLTGVECLALAARTGWAPVYPAFDRNPLDLGGTFGDAVARAVADLRAGTLGIACENPDAPENWPRLLTLDSAEALGPIGEDGLRSLLGTASPGQAPDGIRPHDVPRREPASEGKPGALTPVGGDGIRDLLGTRDLLDTASPTRPPHGAPPRDVTRRAPGPQGKPEAAGPVGGDGGRGTAAPARAPDGIRPRDVTWHEPAPEGKLDLFLSLDGAESAATCLADVVLPIAGGRPGRGRTEFDTFTALAERIGALAAGHLGVREDLVATPLPHGDPGTTAPPGTVLDWRHGACTPVPGRTMPQLTVVVRDYTAVGTAFAAPAPESEPSRIGLRHLFLDHDWAHELGEALPVYRPPLDVHRLLGTARLGPGGQPEVPVRRLTPHDLWSVHSAHPDDLFLPALVSGDGYLWLSPEDAEAIGVADGDLVEAVGPDGVTVARAAVSSRMPAGTVYTRRAPHDGAPGSRAAAGPLLKPTRLLAGHGGLAGGTGDEVTVVRRPGREVE
ncbi:molybdopterin-dependent oxidoreductase [Streptomyces nigra]|uniref:molybdopterin-dependent oxidoreductase n=1 Tax=Streptomyces nigra TaxID=1827580 RepID=UPI0035E28EAE